VPFLFTIKNKNLITKKSLFRFLKINQKNKYFSGLKMKTPLMDNHGLVPDKIILLTIKRSHVYAEKLSRHFETTGLQAPLEDFIMSPRNVFWTTRISIRFLLAISLALTLSSCGFELKLLSGAKDNSSTSPELQYLRGVNIMDLGSGGTVLPGVYNTNYTSPTLAGLQNLKARGLNVVRLPFLWERIQGTLNGPLETAYLGYLLQAMRDAHTAGLKVIIDMHNYAAYTTAGIPARLGSNSGPTIAQYQDVWTKLSTAIQADADAKAALYAYDIMNEPFGMPDTIGSITNAGATKIADFTATDDGWSAEGGTAAYSASFGGSMKASLTTGASSYVIFGIGKNFFSPTPTAGSTIRIRGFMPANVQGTFPRIRLTTLVNFTGTQYPPKEIPRGEAFEVSFTPTGADWTGVTGIIVEAIVNDVDGSGPYELYINDISQGTAIAGKSDEALWEEFSQAGVDAIRANADNSAIMIEGYDFASASKWAINHPTKWITDPQNKIIYQAHTYMDANNSGSYANSYAVDNATAMGNGYTSTADRAVQQVKVFTDWVTAQGVKGFIGELGWPNSHYNPTDYQDWDAAGNAVLTHLDSVNMGATMWATGTWLNAAENIINIY
jgi:hypothetical protein